MNRAAEYVTEETFPDGFGHSSIDNDPNVIAVPVEPRVDRIACHIAHIMKMS
jgi:hypothetical protein